MGSCAWMFFSSLLPCLCMRRKNAFRFVVVAPHSSSLSARLNKKKPPTRETVAQNVLFLGIPLLVCSPFFLCFFYVFVKGSGLDAAQNKSGRIVCLWAKRQRTRTGHSTPHPLSIARSCSYVLFTSIAVTPYGGKMYEQKSIFGKTRSKTK